MVKPKTTGARIRELREELGLNQIELAHKLSVANSTVSQWESDNRVPESSTLMLLADFFQVSIDYIMCRTDDPGAKRKASSSMPPWVSKLPPDMQEFVKEESQHGWPFLRLARGLKMQDLTREELIAIVETWMDAKKEHEKDSGAKK